MKRVRTFVLGAFVGALLLLTVGLGVASADPGLTGGSDGGSTQLNLLPEDPGLE